MLLKQSVSAFCASLILLQPVFCHPGEKPNVVAELKAAHQQRAFATIGHESLSQCDNHLEIQERRNRAMQRRIETFQRLRNERGLNLDEPYLHRRNAAQLRTWAQKSHDHSKTLKFDSKTPNSEVFGANASCILTPDSIIGPYFVAGEQIRKNIVEGHKGIPLYMDIQFINVKTCKPEPNLLIDIWQANATGVYSGVNAAGQGGLQSTFLRGVQKSGADGVVEFETIFPGHYQGRATHQHISVHTGAQVLSNGTYSGGTVSHLSQLYYDQTLVDAVGKLEPYSTNRQTKTANIADTYAGYSATAAYDPFLEYVVIGGSDLTKGVFAWMEIAIDPSANYDAYKQIASYLGPNGATANPSFNIMKAITAPPTHG